MPFNIVLVEPEIPNNTGNIGRLSLASGCHLHLIKPFGFELDDTRVKRAGLDYWQHISLHIYDSLDDFLKQHGEKHLALYSSHGAQPYTSLDYTEDMFLVFGKESVGLSKEMLAQYPNQIYQVPMFSDKIRSLNIANTVGIVVYEGLRQIKL